MARDDVFRVPTVWTSARFENRAFFYDVFISHASGDRSERLARLLREFGCRVWYDKEQYMDDAHWVERVTAGLEESRSVLMFLDDIELEDREWVRCEIVAAAKVERASSSSRGASRIFVVTAGPNSVPPPSWFRRFDTSAKRISLCLVGAEPKADVESFAQTLCELNRIEVEVVNPPVDRLRVRAKEVKKKRSLKPEKLALASDNCLGTHVEMVAKCLDDFSSANKMSQPIMQLLLANAKGLAESEDWSKKKDYISGAMLADLELLAALPDEAADTRGFAYRALEAFSIGGLSSAREILRRCLSWEQSPSLVCIVARQLTSFPDSCLRRDAIRVLLVAAREIANGELFIGLLTNEDAAIEMRYHSLQLTAGEMQKLHPGRRVVELQIRVADAVQRASVSDIEFVLGESLAASGFSRAGGIRKSSFFTAETASVLPAVVERLVEIWPSAGSVNLWCIDFIFHVLEPLNVISHLGVSDCLSQNLRRVFLELLREPLEILESSLNEISAPAASATVALLNQEAKRRKGLLLRLAQPVSIEEQHGMFRWSPLLSGDDISSLISYDFQLNRALECDQKDLAEEKLSAIAQLGGEWRYAFG